MSNTKSTTKAPPSPTKPSTEVAVEHNITELEIIDDILTNKLSGDINGYRNLLTDTTVFGTWTQRQSALVQMERQIIPADSDNPADVEAAEFIKAQIEGIAFDRVLKAMQWGVYYGYGVAEAMWSLVDGKVGISDILVRDRGKFKFDKDKQLLYIGNDSETVVPEAKFWTYSAGGDTTDNPYGLGLAHYLFWAVLFKKSNIKFWLLGLEKAATSMPHVQYDSKAPDPAAEREKALRAGVALKNGSAIATAQGTVVELLKGASGTEDYETLCRYMDEAIAIVILGQVMTSQAIGGQYKAEIQNQVKEDIIKADADLLCSSFNNTIIKWLTKWNFPNANPPKLWLLTSDEADELKKTQAWANMVKVGYRPTLKTVEDTFGGEWEEISTQTNQVAGNQSGTETGKQYDNNQSKNSTDFAESPETNNEIDSMVDQLADEIAPITGGWINKIKQILDDVDSLEELREQLNSLAKQLSFDDYARVFTEANISAKLAGMASVANNNTDEATHV
ncbi:DUF935 domain-containing protein [Psychrobacter sp. I-STPA10]|uniref:DUF935 domain-containing protein n=1 Tax=Psychrobacter sp. I-STPA10 TaxID=2585769 RepID=UPI001E5F2830|nr:DUF935 family protein [Psychrobacter sp. I-STPA10]